MLAIMLCVLLLQRSFCSNIISHLEKCLEVTILTNLTDFINKDYSQLL